MIAFRKSTMWNVTLATTGWQTKTITVVADNYETAVTIARGALVDRHGDAWLRCEVNMVERVPGEIFVACESINASERLR